MKARPLGVTLALAAVLGGWHLCPWRIGVIRGNSMVPTLHSGQVVVIDQKYYQRRRPQAGKIVVFRHAGVTYVKRGYAVEGQTVFFLADGRPGARTLLLPVSRARVQRIRAAMGRRSAFSVRRVRVPPCSFFALGDAPSRSIDSRDLGPISHEELIGRAQTLFATSPVPDLELSPPRARRHASRAAGYRPIPTDL
jgi:signal peptidase I